MITIRIPPQMASLNAGQRTISMAARSLKDAFSQIDAVAPMVGAQIFDDDGAPRPFVGLFLNGDQIVDFENIGEPIPPDSQIAIIMAVAGG